MYCRQLTTKDHKDFYTLAYKSFVERNDIRTDFDHTNFNNVVKNSLIHDQHYCEGLFDNDVLVGFAICMFDTIPFSGTPIAVFDLLHTDVAHRNLDCYQMLLDNVFKVIAERNIKKTALNSGNLLLENDLKTLLLQKNRFVNTSINWERG